MPVVQTTFSVDAAVALAGQLADCGFTDKISRIAAVAVQFGLFCTKRAAESDTPAQCAPPTATADVTARPLGFAIKDQQAGQNGYVANDSVSILKRGRIYVFCETAWTDQAAVSCRFTVEAPDLVLGTVRNDADTDKAVAIPTAKFVGSGTAAGIALVEINLP